MPFTPSDFFDVFARYNQAVWPAQVFLYWLAIVGVLLAWRRSAQASRGAYVALGVLWLWMAIGYHAAFFAEINPAANGFAVMFVLQAAALLSLVFKRPTPLLIPRDDAAGFTGAALIVLGLAVYPILSILFGHTYPAQPTFGLPCPTTIFTIGMLLLVEGGAPKRVLVIPVVWVVVASFGAVKLGVIEDLTLLAALAAAVVARVRTHKPRMIHA